MMTTLADQPVRTVIPDILGTTLDYGSRGPVAAFVELFRRHGVSAVDDITARLVRGERP